MWSRAAVEKGKQLLSQDISEFSISGGRDVCSFLLERVRAYGDSSRKTAPLHQFLSVVSCLHRFGRGEGNLSTPQIKHLTRLGEAILLTEKIFSRFSKMQFLASDLYLALSQAKRRQGNPFESFWDQQVSQLFRSSSRSERALGTVAEAILQSRMGNSGSAMFLIEGIQDAIPQQNYLRLKLEQARLHRLMGQLDSAIILIKRYRSESIPLHWKKEFEWEQLLCDFMLNGELGAFVPHIRKGGSHHDYAYIHEFFLLSRCVKTRSWLTRFPTARSIAKNSSLKLKSSGFMEKCISALEEAYDPGIPRILRVRKLGDSLMQKGKLSTIEKEMLYLAAVTRFFFRSKLHGLAKVPLGEYIQICRRLSSGKSSDVLSLFPDIEIDAWCPLPQHA